MEKDLLEELGGAELSTISSSQNQVASSVGNEEDPSLWGELGHVHSEPTYIETSPDASVISSFIESSLGSSSRSTSTSSSITGGTSNYSNSVGVESISNNIFGSKRTKRNHKNSITKNRASSSSSSSSSGRYSSVSLSETNSLLGEGELHDLSFGGYDTRHCNGTAPVVNLDSFFTRLYQYYYEGGITPMIASRVTEVWLLGFISVFSMSVFVLLDWVRLLQCGREATEVATASGGTIPVDTHDIGSCDELYEFVSFYGFYHPNMFQFLVIVLCISAIGCMVYKFLTLFGEIYRIRDISRFYRTILNVETSELPTMQWSDIVIRLIRAQKDKRLSFQGVVDSANVDALHISNRILRKENYLIALLNKDVLSLSTISKQLEINLDFCLFNHMFDENKMISDSFLNDSRSFKIRLILMGFVNFFLMPVIILAMLVYYFIRNVEEMRSNKDFLGPRRFSLLAQWKFREFNELPHLFTKRINMSLKPSNEYVAQFPPNPLLTVICKFVATVAGAIVGVLLLFTLLDENILLYVKLMDRNLLWYLAIVGGIAGGARALVPTPEQSVYNPDGVMTNVYQHTHYMKQEWRHKCNTYKVRDDFSVLFQNKILLFSKEILGAVTTPFILWFVLPNQVDHILQFCQQVTVHQPGMGHLCGLSLFDFDNFGDVRYGAIKSGSHPIKAAQGKLEKSFVTFAANHPEWHGGDTCKKMLNNLAKFQSKEADLFIRKRYKDDGSGSLHGSSGLFGGLSLISTPGFGSESFSTAKGGESLIYRDPSLLLPLNAEKTGETEEVDMRSTSEQYIFWLDQYFNSFVNMREKTNDSTYNG